MSTAKNIYEGLTNPPPTSQIRPSRILIVDDEVVVREILARKLAGLGHECESCDSGPSALNLLAKREFDLVLADISIPGTGGGVLLKKALQIYPEIAVILIAPVGDIGAAVDALKDGACDYVTKPFSMEKITLSVARALEKRRLLIENRNYQRTLEEQVASRTRQIEEALQVLKQTYHSTLVALSKALDSRDSGTDGHSLRVTFYSARLAQQLGLDPSEIQAIQYGVLLHDIGKIGIPDALLNKAGPMDEEQFSLMQKHPEIGYRILSGIKFLKGAAQLVQQHHERYDGKGFPRQLKGNQIDLGARIFAVADALDDLTSDRPFQPAMDMDSAIREIEKMSGAQLDPRVVKEFLKIPVSEWTNIRKEIAFNTKRADFLRIGNGR